MKPGPSRPIAALFQMIWIGLLVTAVLVGVIQMRRHFTAQAPPPPSSRAVTNAMTVSSPPAGNPKPDANLSDLESALAGADSASVRTAANAVRRRAIADPAYLRELGRLLLDPGQPERLRECVAIILGTIEGPDASAALVAALEHAQDASLRKWIVLGLGSWKEPAGAESFGGLDNPWVVEHPSGLQIVEKNPIRDPAAAAALLKILREGQDEPLRLDAIRALRHSLAEADVRREFAAQFQQPRPPDTTAELGSALAAWAAQAPENQEADKAAVVSALLNAAARPEQSALRFKTEEYLRGLPLTRGEMEKASALLRGANDFETKYWAMAFAADHARYADDDLRPGFISFYTQTVAADPDAKIREKAAQALAAFPATDDSTSALAGALEHDKEWNVRAAAAEALGKLEGSFDPAPFLAKAAASDPNEAVREAAKTSLEAVRSRTAKPAPTE
ncbi:MAG: HEAT repeat domain-containing protein [Verrucomicrobiae bacterium]|nr:HEAT repeat domain-containing protein [Verrucomicrobiae bacterium]